MHQPLHKSHVKFYSSNYKLYEDCGIFLRSSMTMIVAKLASMFGIMVDTVQVS